VTCGVGVQTRTRTCIRGDACGYSCSGNTHETRSCGTTPVDSRWSGYGAWSACSVSCGIGVQTRTRTCIRGDACGLTCSGNTHETRSCGTAEDTTVSSGIGGGNGGGRQCADTNPYDCPTWAVAGFCSDPTYVYYMRENCCVSCQGRILGPIRDFRNRYYSSKNYPEMMAAELGKRKKKKK